MSLCSGLHHAVANIRPSHWSHNLVDTGTARSSTIPSVWPQRPSEFDDFSPAALRLGAVLGSGKGKGTLGSLGPSPSGVQGRKQCRWGIWRWSSPEKGAKKLNCFAYLITTRASNFAHTFEFRARSRDKDRTAIRSAVPESATVTFATRSIATREVVSENEMKIFGEVPVTRTLHCKSEADLR